MIYEIGSENEGLQLGGLTGAVGFSLEKRQLRRDLIEAFKIMKGLDRVEKEKLFPFIESYSAERGHSAHRVCNNHNPTQVLSTYPYIFTH